MTGDQIMQAVGFFVMLATAGWAVWWRIESRVASAREKADKTSDDLAAYKLHVAESYVTKSGMKEIKDEILGAVSGIRDDVRHLGTRIDAMHEANNKPRPRRTSGDA